MLPRQLVLSIDLNAASPVVLANLAKTVDVNERSFDKAGPKLSDIVFADHVLRDDTAAQPCRELRQPQLRSLC